MESGLLLVQVIIGIICCLFGLKFQKTIIAIIGCVVGYLIGDYIVGLFAISGGLDIVLRFGLALVVGAVSFGIFEALIAIIVGFSIFAVVGDMFSGVWYGFLVGILLGVIGGLLVSKFYKLGIILFTSFVGSHLIADGIVSYFTFPAFYIFLAIFIISVIIQVSTNNVKL